MTNKTTVALFTEEFLEDLIFLTDNFNTQKNYEASITSTATFDDPYGYKCDQELEDATLRFQLIFSDIKEQIDNYFNIDFDEFSEFLYQNQYTKDCDLEAKLNEYLEVYLN